MVLVESVVVEGGCPSCGVMSSRVKDRPVCRLKDLPHGSVPLHLREPWMTTLMDLDTGVVLGVVDGRGSAGVKAWLEARSLAWLCGVQVVDIAIDPSAAFHKAISDALPQAPGVLT